MANLPKKTLEYAFADKLICQPGGLTNRQQLYLNKAVVTAADAYFIIAQTKDQGLYYEQFASRMALSLNTARQYANWLVEKKLISIAEDPENRRKVILRVVHEKK